MAEPRYEYTLGAPTAPTLERFMADRESFFRVVVGPLGSGKTTSCPQALLAVASEQRPDDQGIRPTRFYCVRNTYGDLFGTTIPEFRKIWDGLGKFKGAGMERPNFHARFDLEDGTRVDCEVVFIALDKLMDVKHVRGLPATGWWFNEVKELPKSIIDMCLSRTPRYPDRSRVEVSWAGAIGDSNAPDTDEWLYREFWENIEANPGWKLYLQPPAVFKTDMKDSSGRALYDINPDAENLPNLQPNYYQRQLSGKRESWIDVNLGNIPGFDEDGKSVQTGFGPNHVTEGWEYRDKLPLAVGIDYGRTPAACVGQYDPVLSRLWIYWEMTTENMSAENFAPELIRNIRRRHGDVEMEVWGDPAGEDPGQSIDDSPAAILRAEGIPVVKAPTNNFEMRRSAVDSMLKELAIDGRPRLLVSQECKVLRKALSGKYRFKRVGVAGEERFHDVPDKNSASHVAEALQYVSLGIGEGKRIAKRPKRRRGPSVVEYEGYR